MKRMILAALLIAAVFAVSISGYAIMNKETADILNLIDEAEAVADSGDFREMKKYAEKISAEWQKSGTLISKTARHGNMDELVLMFSDMLSAIENENKEEFKKSCAESRALLEHIRDTERVAMGNVF